MSFNQQGQRQQAPRRQSTQRQLQSAPPVGFAKIHVDAGVLDLSRGSAAAIARDANGTYLGSSSLVIDGLYDPAVLEAMACREGVALAQDLGIDRFVISCDSKQVVADILCGSRGSIATIAEEIIQRMPMQHCKIIFEGRETNTEAHNIARFFSFSFKRAPPVASRAL